MTTINTSITANQAGLLSAIDLSELPLPEILEPISYEDTLQTLLDDVRTFLKEPYIFHEADPAYIILQACAYRLKLTREDYQNQTRQNLIAYATDAMLDHIGANALYKCPRLTIVEANPNAIPPIEAVMESDDAYRRRLVLSNEGYTTAGSYGAYLYHTLTATGEVRDAGIISYQPDGSVDVYVLGQASDGSISDDGLNKVKLKLTDQFVRPMCEVVRVHRTNVTTYTVNIELTVYPGPAAELIRTQAIERVTEYTQKHFANGHDITLQGLSAAAGVAGVQNQRNLSMSADIVNDNSTASRCTAINITIVGTAI